MGIPETITELLEPVVATLDVEILDVEWNGNSLRLVVDRLWAEGEVADKTNGITTSQLQEVNRLISPILDQHDPIPGRYTLEVSSPGIERKLTKPDHFSRAVGEEVVIKMLPGETPRRIRGPLVAFDSDAERLTIDAIEVDGIDRAQTESVVLDLASVQKARTSFNWGPTPKKGGHVKKAGGAKKGGRTPKDTSTAAVPTTESKTE